MVKTKMANEHHVLGLSGGKDSAALAVFMRQRYPALNIRYFFTDTGKELPEVYDFLAKLEGFLGKPIERLNPNRDFDFWLRQYGHFLPSPRTRWCTRQLKLLPFRQWVKPWLTAGDTVYSYVAIRSDEEHREALVSQNDNLHVKLPFREHGVDKQSVLDLLDAAGVGLPKYYSWRSRSGCTFCFFQQKIEWVRLREQHPESYEEAKRYEKSALEHGSPFTWIQGESLTDLENPERVSQILADYEIRKQRERARIPINPLRPAPSENLELDDLYLEDEGGGACLVCHK
jgi:3'-phosphoadenosine 5'-phosphosulfate sulfotransferase (PAPS reductase)/FAD synthetase